DPRREKAIANLKLQLSQLKQELEAAEGAAREVAPPSESEPGDDAAAHQQAMFEAIQRYFQRYMKPGSMPGPPSASNSLPAAKPGPYQPALAGANTDAAGPTRTAEEYLQQQLAEARTALAGLSTQYADSHPLVVEQRAKIASLEQQFAELQRSQPITQRPQDSGPSSSSPTPGTGPTIDPTSGLLEPNPAEIYREALVAKQQLDDLETLAETVRRCQPEALPSEAANDPRYREIKSDYDRYVGETTDFAKQQIASDHARMRNWITNVYLPQLNAQSQFLLNKYRRLSKEYQERLASRRQSNGGDAPLESDNTGPEADSKAYEYRIQPGDTLPAIAEAYRQKGIHVTVEQILQANPTLNPKRIRAGQRILIPSSSLK
ncbi:MAG: LysM peptidoglycan-binding domain-containing protein, partial [Verrucomicrobia bacterium]|nr:LysM peptidoglycan-binding domain-containing protein [Verrucomicrobiota bacterium]